MISYRKLDNTTTDELYKTFIEAFSDYKVKMNLSISEFEYMINKNGYMAEVSIGAFKDNKLVGFLLTAVRNVQGKLNAYDAATAVLKEYRNKVITSKMFSMLKDILISKGVERYQLEVIKDNEAAFKTYKNQGFEISREFNCFKLEKGNLTSNFNIEHKNRFTDLEWEKLSEFWDSNPSWQNSIESIKHSKSQHKLSNIIIDNKIAAYGVIDIATGDIKKIAVNKEYRGKGYGKAIVLDLIKWAESKIITILNVDAENYPMESFLKHIGFSDYVKQYEMVLNL